MLRRRHQLALYLWEVKNTHINSVTSSQVIKLPCTSHPKHSNGASGKKLKGTKISTTGNTSDRRGWISRREQSMDCGCTLKQDTSVNPCKSEAANSLRGFYSKKNPMLNGVLSIQKGDSESRILELERQKKSSCFLQLVLISHYTNVPWGVTLLQGYYTQSLLTPRSQIKINQIYSSI